MFNFDTKKILLGTVGNQNPIEDPTIGPNGTAVVTRFNTFLNDLQIELNSKLPYLPGQLVVGNSNGGFSLLPPSINRSVLCIDLTQPTGVKWEERVDLLTNQTIGGIKTFAAAVRLNDTLTVYNQSLFKDDVLVETDLVANTLQSNTTLNVLTNGTIGGTLNVNGASNFEGEVIIDDNLGVSGTVAINGNIAASGAAFASAAITNQLSTDTLLVDISAEIASLTVLNDATLPTLAINGYLTTTDYISSGTYLTVTTDANIGNNAVVGNNLSAETLVVGDSIEVGGDSLISADLAVLGSISGSTNLQVLGTSNLNIVNIAGALSATSTASFSTIDTSGSVIIGGNAQVTGSSLLIGSTTIQDSLTVSDDTTLQSRLFVNGVSQFNNVINSSSSVSIAQTLEVDGNVTLGEDLDVIGNTSTNTITTTSTGSVLVQAQINTLASNTISNTGLLTTNNINTVNATVSSTLTCSSFLVASNINTNNFTATTSTLNNVTINGVLNYSNLSGTNTGDEVLATNTVHGIVKTDSTSGDPIVYLKQSVDTLFIPKANIFTYTINNSSIPPNGVITVLHNLNEALPSSITVWGDNRVVTNAVITATSNNVVEVNTTGITGITNWTIKVMK